MHKLIIPKPLQKKQKNLTSQKILKIKKNIVLNKQNVLT